MAAHSLKVWAMSMGASTGAPTNLRYLLEHAKFGRFEVDKKKKETVTALLNKKICKGHFDERFIRAIVIFDNNDIYAVDADGVVKHKNQQYYISPGAFYRLQKYCPGFNL